MCEYKKTDEQMKSTYQKLHTIRGIETILSYIAGYMVFFQDVSYKAIGLTDLSKIQRGKSIQYSWR